MEKVGVMKPEPRGASSTAIEHGNTEEGIVKRRKRLTADERLVKK